jgi:bacteriocin biosynthesis cyclodehydratase domain-containing protein
MLLQLKPGLRPLWRGPTTVQLGVDPRVSTVLDGLTADERSALVLLVEGVDEQLLAPHPELVDLLTAAGALVRRRAGRAAHSRLGRRREALTPDAQAWSLARPEQDGDGWQVLADRGRRQVVVSGEGRTAAALAETLRVAGVGRVTTVPAGPLPPRLGGAGLVVLVGRRAIDPTVAGPLLRHDVPHLAVVVREATIVVGPLVVPGMGPCLRCLDLHRTDRDPLWPVVLAQALTEAAAPEETASSQLAAALAALQVLAQLDAAISPSRPATFAATLEVELAEGLVSRREWPAHPSCGCTWPPRHPPPDAAGSGTSDNG